MKDYRRYPGAASAHACVRDDKRTPPVDRPVMISVWSLSVDEVRIPRIDIDDAAVAADHLAPRQGSCRSLRSVVLRSSPDAARSQIIRSEERRVGKECRSRW